MNAPLTSGALVTDSPFMTQTINTYHKESQVIVISQIAQRGHSVSKKEISLCKTAFELMKLNNFTLFL